MINILDISTNSISNTTKVGIEVYETKGTVEKMVDKLTITLPGKYLTVNDELRTLIDQELNKNGFIYNPTVG